tara:strand:+ start:1183 stop:1818 length:636 start_codon:yes stop_codon:yes gene_type:complete
MKKLLSILTLTLVVTLGYSQNTYVGVSAGIAANAGGGWADNTGVRGGDISALNIGHYFNDRWGIEINMSTSNHEITDNDVASMGIGYWSVGPSYVWARGENMYMEVKPQIILGMKSKITNRRDFYYNDVNINEGGDSWTGSTFNFKIGNSLVIGTGKLKLSIDIDYMGGNWRTYDTITVPDGAVETDMEDTDYPSSAFNRMMFSIGLRRSF